MACVGGSGVRRPPNGGGVDEQSTDASDRRKAESSRQESR